MRYAAEVMDLLAAFPGRRFRMAEIVNHVARGRAVGSAERERIRKSIRRVIEALIEAKCVLRTKPRQRVTVLYWWKSSGT